MKCKNCGHEIKKNNRKIVRPPGEKPYSVCRHCPGKEIEAAAPRTTNKKKNEATARSTKASVQRLTPRTPAPPIQPLSLPPRTGLTFTSAVHDTGTRFFVRPGMADKIKRIQSGKYGGPSSILEIIPVPSEQVDAFPDHFQGLIEIQVTIKGEG